MYAIKKIKLKENGVEGMRAPKGRNNNASGWERRGVKRRMRASKVSVASMMSRGIKLKVKAESESSRA